MKTPIQELIEEMEKSPLMYAPALILISSRKMLEKEKALLIKTHGNKKVYDSQIDPTIVTGEQWYNETFNTKEKFNRDNVFEINTKERQPQ